MRGRVTYRDGRHPSRVADWVDPADDVPADIADVVADFRYLRAAHARDAIPMRDVRVTLEAMARIDDDAAAAEALEHCDELTHALLLVPLHRNRTGSIAERLHAAARAALGKLRADRGARTKGYQVMLAETIVAGWHSATGETRPPVWTSVYGSASPLLEHAGRIFDAVEQARFDRTKLAALLRGAISTLIRAGRDPA